MKTYARIGITVMVLVLSWFIAGEDAQARHGHSHVYGGLWVGPGWIEPYPYYSYPYYPYYREPPIIVQQPDVYVQPAPAPTQQPTYWYYCKDPQGYYPYVKQCPTGWLKVVPAPPGQSISPPVP
jgi:hypothetical protein